MRQKKIKLDKSIMNKKINKKRRLKKIVFTEKG